MVGTRIRFLEDRLEIHGGLTDFLQNTKWDVGSLQGVEFVLGRMCGVEAKLLSWCSLVCFGF